jgi:nucleotide-binding universal stress UspA family protein
MKPIKTILHPTDFSPESSYALDLACALARGQGARIVILHAVPSPTPVVGADVADLAKAEAAQRELKSYEEEMRARLSDLRTPDSKLRIERLLKEGEVAATILHVADELACDLIVMGTHGRSRIYQFMMGSVAAAVSREAHCPVVTVKLPPACLPSQEEETRPEACLVT